MIESLFSTNAIIISPIILLFIYKYLILGVYIMPKLTMWKPEKTKDYTYFDRIISEQFFVGGLGVYVHKYIGPYQTRKDTTAAQPNYLEGNETDPISGEKTNPEGIVNETKIQDLLLLENRDRKYEKNIYELKGVYNVSDNDFDLTQFGLFLTQDVFYMTFHINDMVDTIGRKLMSGDVLELPNLMEYLGLEITDQPIPKYYVIQDTNRGGEGFSQTWWPHIWRVKLGPITDSQEFAGILHEPGESDRNDAVSVYNRTLNINNQVVKEATGNAECYTSPLAEHLFGYSAAENEVTYDPEIPTGDVFPSSPNIGDYFVRTDFQPNRLFRWAGTLWQRLYENTDVETWEETTFNAGSFIENTDNTTLNANTEFAERQSITNPIKSKE
jgi:hypothetical protein